MQTTVRTKSLVAAGRFNRDDTATTEHDYTAELEQWIEATGATDLAITECADPQRWEAVTKLPGWDHWRAAGGNGANECGFAWDRKVWRLVEAHSPAVTTDTYFHDASYGGGATAPVHAPTVVLEHVETRVLRIRSMMHTPSHVEGAKGFGKLKRRVTAYRSAIAGWLAFILKLLGKYPHAAVHLSADWNLNIKLPWVKAFVKHAFPGWELVADTSGTGDMGRRLITYSLIRGAIKPKGLPRVLVRRKNGKRIEWQSSDHSPVVETLEQQVLYPVTPPHSTTTPPTHVPPTPAPHPAASTVERAIAAARGEIGYHEGRSGGHWNNDEKYAAQVPGLAWANGYAWCAVFVCWCLVQSGLDLRKALPGGATASVQHITDAAKAAGRFSEFPGLGAIILYGTTGGVHTGFVVSYGPTTVTTVEGNTNTDGSPEGDGVYLKTHDRRSSYIYGYAYPEYPGGITSADPAWKTGAKR